MSNVSAAPNHRTRPGQERVRWERCARGALGYGARFAPQRRGVNTHRAGESSRPVDREDKEGQRAPLGCGSLRQGAASAVEALVSTGEVERVELDGHRGALPNAAMLHARMEARSWAGRALHGEALAPHARVEPRSFAIPTTHARRVRLPGAGQHGGAPRAQGSSGTVIARVALAPDRTPPRGYSAHPARPVAHHPRPLDVAPGVAPSGEARGLSAPRRGVARVTGEAIPPEPAAPVPRSTSPGAELHPRLTPRERALGTYCHIVARAARRSSPLCVYCVCVCPTARHTL